MIRRVGQPIRQVIENRIRIETRALRQQRSQAFHAERLARDRLLRQSAPMTDFYLGNRGQQRRAAQRIESRIASRASG